MPTSLLAAFFLSFLALLSPTTDAAICNSTELSELAEALSTLPTCTEYSACVRDVGVVLPFTVPPTTTQIAAMCASTACKALIAIAVTLKLPDCEVVVNGIAYNVLLVRARRVQQCSSESHSSSITASVSSSEAGVDSSSTSEQ